MTWEARPTGKRGRQPTYSDAAIQTCFMVKVLFGMALRQTTGFVESLLQLSGLDRSVPDFSTLSRRQKARGVNILFRGVTGPLHLLIPSRDITAQHNCLIMRFGATVDNAWRFGTGKTQQTVTVRGNKIANDGSLVRQWALEGHGIILKSELDVARDLEEGRLVALLEDYSAPPNPLQMMFPPGRAQPRRVRALAKALDEAMAAREMR